MNNRADLPDILKVARRYGAKLRKVGAEYVGPCPRCGGQDRFVINPAKQVFLCRQGDAGGDVIELVKYLDGVDYRTAVETLLGEQRKVHRLTVEISTVKKHTGNVPFVTLAIQMWDESVALPGTCGELHFVKHRQLSIHNLGDLSHALRWHERRSCIVALMTDTVTGEPTGVHRTFLDNAGLKTERKMLGRQGVIRLSPDDAVTQGLGLVEGIEDGIAVLLSGWAPIWAATSAGGIERFPVLSGIEALTLFADEDNVGMKAARNCADRWNKQGKETCISPPPSLGVIRAA